MSASCCSKCKTKLGIDYLHTVCKSCVVDQPEFWDWQQMGEMMLQGMKKEDLRIFSGTGAVAFVNSKINQLRKEHGLNEIFLQLQL